MATRIIDCMAAASIRPSELAAIIGVSQQAVSQWSHGVSRPNHENLRRLAAALGVTADLIISAGTSTDPERRARVRVAPARIFR